MRSRIYVFGDSFAMGHLDYDRGGWVQRMRLDIEKKHDAKILVYGLGISGAKIGDFDDIVEDEIEHRRQDPGPIHVILQVGTNDVPSEWNPEGTDISAFKASALHIIEQTAKYDSIIFLGLTKVSENSYAGHKNENMGIYNKVLRDICKKNNTKFINLFDMDLELNKDGLHPNSEGHRKIFEKVKDELEKLGYIS